MAKQSFSIDVPSNPDCLINLGTKILTKHAELGANSPFTNIKNWGDFTDLNTAADTSNKSSKDFAQKSVEATQARDLILGAKGTLKENTVRWFVMSARDVLLGPNKGSEQKLGEFGFEVTYTAQTSKTKTKAKTTPTT